MSNYPQMTNTELEKELQELTKHVSESSKKAAPLPTVEKLQKMLADLQADQSNNILVVSALKTMQGVVHELQVNQVELEMQNRELREARQELEISHQRYVDLYDFAPNGYVTLDEKGVIQEINLPGAQMLGKERSHLIGKPFVVYVARGESRRFLDHLERCQQGETTVKTELTLKGNRARAVQLLTIPLGDDVQQQHIYRTALLDITERQQAEEAKRVSEILSQSVLGSLSAQIAVLSKDGKIIAVNETWKRFARENGNKSPSAGLGENYLHVCHRSCLDDSKAREALAGVQSVLDGTQPGFTLEYPCHSPEQERWFLMKATPLQGELGGAVIAHNNITERKRAELALRESEARMGGIINSAMDAIISTDDQQRIVLFNRAAEKMFGYSSEDMLGQSLARLIPAKFRDLHDAHIRRFGATGETTRAMGALNAVSGVRRNGEEFPIEASISQIEISGQKLFTVILRDITDSLRANERLVEQATLLDQAHEAIVVRDLDGCIRYWGRGAEQLYGWTAEEVIGRSSEELYYRNNPSPLIEATRKTIENGKWNGELRHITKGGGEVIVEGHWTLVRDAQGKPKNILAINTDITEKKKLEAQFLRAQRLESIGTLASGIAHDLNNVLSPIMMGAQMLQMKQQDEQSRRLLSLMQSNASRGAEMIKQVLSFARGIGGGRVRLQPKHLIREVVRIVEETFPKSIRIERRLAEELWTINGDATQLHQVLLNLCINARDAMPQGGTLTIVAENQPLDQLYAHMLKGAAPGNYVVVTIADTGVGIPPEIIDRIFDPFFTTKEPGQGTGLGLATVQGIVTNHGGFITVESKPGLGAKFSLYLPAQEVDSRSQDTEQHPEMPAGNGELILVIDDEAGVCEMARTVLEAFGYRALTADNGATALGVFASHLNEISVVITDLMMPVMDGIATIRSLRKMNPEIRIIASSGLTDPDRTDELKLLPVNDLLEKPYNAEALLNIVAKVLRNPLPLTTNS